MKPSCAVAVSAFACWATGCGANNTPCPPLADFETFTMQVSGPFGEACVGPGTMITTTVQKHAAGANLASFTFVGERIRPASSDGSCPQSSVAFQTTGEVVCAEVSETSRALTASETDDLRELFRSIRCDGRSPLALCLLRQDQNQTCVKTSFAWDDQHAPDWTCNLGGDFVVAIEDSLRIRQFLETLARE